MAQVQRRRKVFDERLSDGRSVEEAVKQLAPLLLQRPAIVAPAGEQSVSPPRPLVTGNVIPSDAPVVPAAVSTPTLTRPRLVAAAELQRKLAAVGGVPEGASSIAATPPEGIDYDPTGIRRRPRIADPLGHLEKNIQYEQANPEGAKEGRGVLGKIWDVARSAGIGAHEARLANPNDPAAAIGGAFGGGVAQGFSPETLPQMLQQQRLGSLRQQWGQMVGQRKMASELEDDALNREVKRAQLEKLKRPEAADVKMFQGADGLQYEYDPAAKVAREIPGQGRKAAGSPKVLRTVERGGKVWYETEEGLKPALDAEGRQLEEPMVEVNYGGQRFKVPEREAARMAADVEAANVSTGNRHAGESYEDTVRQTERQHADQLKRWEDAAKATNEVKELWAKLSRAKAEADNPPVGKDGKIDEASVRYLQQQAKYAEEDFRAAASRTSQLYPEFVEHDKLGWPMAVKPRPSSPVPPRRPAPARRSAPVSPRSGSGRSTAPRPKRDPLGLFN